MTRSLNVYWDDKIVGRFWLDDKRKFVFQYDAAWLASPETLPISLRLPLKAEAFKADAARPFFSNLLPEARIRTLIAKRFGVSEGNDYRLLEELGGDCAGALTILPEGKTPGAGGDYAPVSEEELSKMIEDMPRRPLLTSMEGLRLSLAGAQNKLPVFVKDGSLFLPRGTHASFHILKPKIPEFKDTVENEWFCMTLARRCGLPVPEVNI